MARALFPALLLAFALVRPSGAQKTNKPAQPAAAQEQEPPEEDESVKPEQFSFNPLQATKEITVGNFYFKKGNYRAAANRYRRATKFDPGSPDAFRKLGEADEKMRDFPEARKAYEKYFTLSTDAKEVKSVKRRMASWPASSAQK